jgi:uncharacterized membrane protein
MELHEWLKFFHILVSIVWVGGVIVTYAMMEQARRSPDRSVVLHLARQSEWIGPRLIGPSAAAVVGIGIWLVFVEKKYVSFSQTWIWLTLILVAVSMIQNAVFAGPEDRRIAHAAEEAATEDGEAMRRLSRRIWLARFDVLILAVVVGLMVFKPGVPGE